MAAPIQRYSDPRLYGTNLVKPFTTSYQWIRTVVHPLHPKANRIAECGIRAIKVITGVIALAITAAPALIGRFIQIIHYHSLSKVYRANPPAIDIDGIKLPNLAECSLPAVNKYHGTSELAAIGILRWGFDLERTASGSKMAQAVYVSASDVVSVDYGNDQLVMNMDLRLGEIAYLNDQNLGQFKAQVCEIQGLSEKKTMAAVRKLFYQNGYRAIKYDLFYHYGRTEAWAVYDPSCLSIIRIKPSPSVIPALIANGDRRVLSQI